MRDPDGLVFLVGFMGAGKSTVGRALARILGWDFLDLDDQIVAAEGRSIAAIFRGEGEAFFRGREAAILEGLRGRARLVVACGGGTYADPACRSIIDRLGRAVWLQVPVERALRRCAGQEGERPLLEDAARAEALYRARLPAYRAAPLRVEAGIGPPERVAERIAGLL